MTYRGRFAPSPTGSLHFGSLVAAVASYADALHHGGEWLVRMEDVDEQRVVEGSADQILYTLEAFGFQWQGEVLFQSQRKSRYREVLDILAKRKLIYTCGCSRREIALQADTGIEGPVYPGTCRNNGMSMDTGKAIRLYTHEEDICFQDLIQGIHCQALSRDIGDFIIRRADGYTAYQLAVVVDDADQGINHIVRGADLLLSTPRQIYLQQLLGFEHPVYAHVPLVVDEQGQKLSKQDQARPVLVERPLKSLGAAWSFLQQPSLPHDLDKVEDFWPWAAEQWDIQQLSACYQ